MAKRKIILVPDEILRKKSEKIEKITDTMNKDPNFKSLFNKKVDLNKDKHLFSKNLE